MKTFLTCASHSPLLYCYDKAPDDWDGLQKAYAEREQEIREFDPDLVFAFGADHYNGFFLKLMPSFCLGLNAEAVGDIGGFAGPLDVPHTEAADAVEFVRGLRFVRYVDELRGGRLHAKSEFVGPDSSREVIVEVAD